MRDARDTVLWETASLRNGPHCDPDLELGVSIISSAVGRRPVGDGNSPQCRCVACPPKLKSLRHLRSAPPLSTTSSSAPIDADAAELVEICDSAPYPPCGTAVVLPDPEPALTVPITGQLLDDRNFQSAGWVVRCSYARRIRLGICRSVAACVTLTTEPGGTPPPSPPQLDDSPAPNPPETRSPRSLGPATTTILPHRMLRDGAAAMQSPHRLMKLQSR